ncbi:MAG: peptidase domain-containing ABC transporter [Acidobacteriota bacterium]|nr:peptidase domain-containing ABC transporter [Acidobacteriota bacterium]
MTRLFLQDSPVDNGAACLATLLAHHGLFITPVDLMRDLPTSRAGISAERLLEEADRYGLQGAVQALEPDQFSRMETPFLAYTTRDQEEDNHGVVIFKVQGDRLHVGDPALGVYRIPTARFIQKYKGRVIGFRRKPSFTPGVRSQTYLRRFCRFLKGYKLQISAMVGLGALLSLFGFALIYLSKYFVDSVLPQQAKNALWVFAGVYFTARLLNAGVEAANGLFTVIIRNAVTKTLSRHFFKRMVHLKKKHIDNRGESDFLQVFTQIDALSDGIAGYFSSFVLVALGMLIKAGFLVLLYDPVLVSILLVILVLNASAGLIFSRVTAERTNRQILVSIGINTLILEGLADVRVLRIFGASDWFRSHFRRLLNESLDLLRRIATLQVAGRSLADLLNMISEAAIFIICGMRIMEGNYSVGDFLLFFSFAQGLAAESLKFPELILSFPTQLRAFARLQGVLALDPEPSGDQDPGGEGIKVEMHRVGFGYTPGKPVLKDISLVLPQGKTTALVGESGSGKTTLMNLLLGFYQPDSGEILVNGRNLREWDLTRYRSRVSAVFQNTALLSKTLLQNVTLGNEALSIEVVAETARTLGIETFIQKLPMHYSQLLYPGALSGGQTQQVGILRAMCKPFDLLVMDEATSHLDSQTEEKIVNGITALCGGNKTRVIIAHRLSTVKAADCIVAMRDGRIVEMGTHEQLVALKGYYLELIQRQYEVDLAPTPGP